MKLVELKKEMYDRYVWLDRVIAHDLNFDLIEKLYSREIISFPERMQALKFNERIFRNYER